ncbi:hypothetical protein BC829DRAFT_431139 [Chytridium lagenaria]|nr:hypothetical protein BC829DRAFT_431139 [Chytridium lagenaria]
MRLLQTIRWSRLQGASPMTSLRHLHRQCTQLPIMSVISSSSLQSPRLTFLASSRAQPLSTTSIIQPTSASTPESTSIPKSSSDQLIEAVEGHLKNSLPLPNFAALCYTLIPSVPTSANLEPLKSRQWTAIFTALASLYKKSDIHIIADQAWTLMTKDGPPPKLSRDCMWLYSVSSLEENRSKGPMMSEDIRKTAKDFLVAMGFSLEKKRMFIEGWEAIKQGHSHYLTLFALRPSKSSDSNPLPVLNTAKDYDDFLAFFLGVYPTAAEMAKLAKSAVQEILVQKAQEGHPITLRNLGILAHLTIDVTEISRLLDTLEKYVKTLEVDSSLDENGEVSSDVVEMMAGRVNSYNYSVESYADFKKIWTAISDERKGQISAKAFGAAITAHLTRRNCNAAIEVLITARSR